MEKRDETEKIVLNNPVPECGWETWAFQKHAHKLVDAKKIFVWIEDRELARARAMRAVNPFNTPDWQIDPNHMFPMNADQLRHEGIPPGEARAKPFDPRILIDAISQPV